MLDSIKKFKTAGIIISILLFICGVVICVKPARVGLYVTWFMMAYLLVNGIFRLVRYFCIPKEVRTGWMLADGIISTLVAIIILCGIADTPILSTISLVAVIGYFIGFYEIFVGISQICGSGAAKAVGASSGWLIFIGIVNILCGIFVVCRPVISFIAFEWIIGLYMIIFSITAFIECLCMKKKED